MSVGWSPSIFPPPNLKKLFQKLQYSAVIDNRCSFCQELAFPLLFHSVSSFLSVRVFFVLLVSFPVCILFLHFSPYKTILLSPLPSFVVSCFHYLYPISPLGYLKVGYFFSCISPLSQFYFPQFPLPSGMQLYLLLCWQILGGAGQPKHTLLVRGAAGGNSPSPNFKKIENTYHVLYKICYITQRSTETF